MYGRQNSYPLLHHAIDGHDVGHNSFPIDNIDSLHKTSEESSAYQDNLNWFKANEKPEALLAIADNPNGMKLVIAWLNISTKPAGKLTKPNEESESEIWTWIWENTNYSKKEILDKLGISLSESGLEARLKPLIGNRVIYPDGTVNPSVQKYRQYSPKHWTTLPHPCF